MLPDPAVQFDAYEPVDLHTYQEAVRELLAAKGFSASMDDFWQMLALIHSEISEATDAYKKGADYQTVGIELIDALIRILHALNTLGVDAEQLFQKKMAANWKRPYRYNTVRAR